MISFKQFLSEDTSKTKSISAEDAIAWMEANANGYLNNGRYLYRGFHNTGIQIGSSGNFTRTSISGPNIYTTWIDGNSKFKDWPKRSKSFICSDHNIKAKSYGNLFTVVSKDTNLVGIVKDRDIWFAKLNNPELSLKQLEDFTESLFIYFKLTFNSYKTLDEILKQVSYVHVLDIPRDEYIYDIEEEGINLFLKSKKKDLYEYWASLVSPETFDKTLANDLPETGGEMWVQGECLFLSTVDSQLSAGDRDKILDWADKYPEFRSFLLQHWLAT